MRTKDILNQVKKDYNIIAPHFSHTRRFIWPDIKPFLKSVKKGNRVLDVGCGSGRLYQALRGKKIDYLGIDFSERLIEIARKGYPQAKFKIGDVSRKKTWDKVKKFDVCFCIAVLHHFPTSREQLKVLKYICKSLENGGLLVIGVWNLWQKKFWKIHLGQFFWKIKQGLKFKWLLFPYKLSDGKKTTKRIDRFCYCFTDKDLENLVQKAGFEIIEKKKGRNLWIKAQKKGGEKE